MKDLMTSQEVAEYLGVSLHAVYVAAQRGRLARRPDGLFASQDVVRYDVTCLSRPAQTTGNVGDVLRLAPMDSYSARIAFLERTIQGRKNGLSWPGTLQFAAEGLVSS